MSAHDPDHYKAGGIETIDYMRAKSTPEEFAAYCKLSVEKYRSRAGKKEGATELQDARKALRFCEWWVEALEGSGALEDGAGRSSIEDWTIAMALDGSIKMNQEEKDNT